MCVQGGVGGLIHGLVNFDQLPGYPANSAIFPSAQAELCKQWKNFNQCQPNSVVVLRKCVLKCEFGVIFEI